MNKEDYSVTPAREEKRYFIPRIVEVSKEEYEAYVARDEYNKKMAATLNAPWYIQLANNVLGRI